MVAIIKFVLFSLFAGTLTISCRHSGKNTPDRHPQVKRQPGPQQPEYPETGPQQPEYPETVPQTPPVTPTSGPRSLGCGLKMPAAGEENRSIQVGSGSRKYLLVMPQNYDSRKPYALVFWWHGAGASPEMTRGVPNYNHSPNLERIGRDQVFFVHPRAIPGVGLTWERGENGRDFRFFDRLYEDLTNTYCIDPARVFAIGVSNGATFANHLASVRPDKITGLVAVALPAIGAAWHQVATRSMLIQDDRDNFSSAKATWKKVAADSSCSIEPNLEPRNPNRCFTLSGCSLPVALCPWRVKDGWKPHDWPRFDGADDQIWEFLN